MSFKQLQKEYKKMAEYYTQEALNVDNNPDLVKHLNSKATDIMYVFNNANTFFEVFKVGAELDKTKDSPAADVIFDMLYNHYDYENKREVAEFVKQQLGKQGIIT